MTIRLEDLFSPEELDTEYASMEEAIDSALIDLEDKGLIEPCIVDGKPGYKLTNLGWEVVQNLKKEMH